MNTRIMAVLLLAVFLFLGACATASTPPLPELIKTQNLSPEVVEIITKYRLLVRDGAIDSIEDQILSKVAHVFPNPNNYVLSNTEDEVAILSGEGNKKTFAKKLATPNFNIYFNPAELEIVTDVMLIAEISLEKAISFFEFAPNVKIGIYLFETKEDRNKISRWEVHYPDIYVWSPESHISNEAYSYVLGHEIVHMVEIAYLGRHWEWSWLNEGVADYISGECFGCGRGIEGLTYYAARQELQSLRDMVSNDDWISFIDREYWIVYHQSWSVIEYLIEEYGKRQVVALFDLSRQGYEPNKAVEKALGIDMDELEEAWRVWIKTEYQIG